MMVSEEKAKRIAAALERLAAAYEQEAKALDQEVKAFEQEAEKSSWVMCFRCFPAHPMDWHNPCEKYR